MNPSFRLSGFARIVALGLCAVLSGTLGALAGTTGGLNGTVTDAGTSAPIAGAKVTVSSPSQAESVMTDASGRFTFVSLAPDTYAVSVEKSGYDRLSVAGVSVFADAQQTVPLTLHRPLKTIANVTSRSASGLVRPGTTADVYSVNAAQQERTSVLGGGGNLNSAYSAIASVPGAYVPSNQSGYNQAVHVRGGDSYEVGYEFDGIPVNRGFDNYPSGSLSSLGQLELQVYTGATPANGEAQGLAGFINQVIKTGTTPGYGSIAAAVGSPAFYHSLNVEAAGASPNRMFSYYAGFGGFNQDHRYVDQRNGETLANEFGPILDTCPSSPPTTVPSCFTNGAPNVGQAGTPGYILGPLQYGGTSAANVATRTSVINLHFGIPHKRDGGRDDVQLLYDNDEIFTALYNSAIDEGLNNFQGSTYGAGVLPYYTDSFQYDGPIGSFLPANYQSLVVPYLFPSSPQNRQFNAPIPPTQRDVGYNGQAIVKLQYQKNFGADSYLRLYGYTYYSDYIGTGPISSWQPYTGFDSGDYELSSHTRGVSATFAKQFGSKNLVQAQASYTTSNAIRVFNSQMFGSADSFAVLVNPNDLTHGVCYAAPSAGTVATPTTCNDGGVLTTNGGATFASLAGIGYANLGPQYSGSVNLPPDPTQYTCGTSTCAFYVAENGAYGEFNDVKPVFTGYSLTDEFRPNDRLSVNLGLRLDRYDFKGANTSGPARPFWFDAFNNDTCFDTQNLTLYDKTSLADGSSIPIQSSCTTAGSQYQAANMQNVPSQSFVYNILQPRIGVTYTLSPDTVLRASFGKYNEQPSSAYEQYDALQSNLPNTLVAFYSLGFTTPGHQVRPPISYNSDFSLEHHFKGTSFSVKLTPFYRQTKDQVENFYTNIKAGFVSGSNAGQQTSRGFELALSGGDFERNGLAGQLSFAYTNTFVKYNTLPNGTTILSPINADIANYNGYTKFCASNSSDARCGASSANAAPCYQPANIGGDPAAPNPNSGAADPTCSTPGDIANPYWNAPVQALLDPNANYLPYSTNPGGIGTGVNAYNYPYVATLILNYKHDRFSITPSFQFVGGNRYGAPEVMPGVDPASGCNPLSGSVAGDPRYPYGAGGGSPYDATTCAAQIGAIPDSFTGHFDGIGEFREPSQLLGHVRISYEASKNVTFSLTLANVVNTCFGGQQTRFTYYSSKDVCSYGNLANFVAPVGNAYNPGDNVQPFLRYPYEPTFGTYNDLTSSLNQPFSAYLTMKIKL
ncbi:MAG TPA: TonB-dependent receptor [Candidatus Baltobacteraceae bacterium]|jgi:hypothetical protein